MRRQDWQLRFAEFATARANTPFEWGKNDCCLFTVDCVYAMTGEDHGEAFRGRYSTALQAERIVKEHGGVRQLATEAWGEPVSPLMASVGDVVVMETDGREALAICNGTSAIGAGRNGIAVLSMDAALAAWKI